MRNENLYNIGLEKKLTPLTIPMRLPYVLWLTGLSGSGKSTLAKGLLKRWYFPEQCPIYIDGDEFRKSFCQDLGFTKIDRKENLRRAAELCKMLLLSGQNVIATFISPLESDRQMIRSIIGEEHFIEVYIHCDIERCIQRDPKGLYQKALRGEIPNFTGITAPYEIPVCPDLIIDTEKHSLLDSLGQLIVYIEHHLYDIDRKGTNRNYYDDMSYAMYI